MSAPELKPCFHCRCDHADMYDVSDGSTPHSLHQVRCGVCGTSGPIAPSEDQATQWWQSLATSEADALRKARMQAISDGAQMQDLMEEADALRAEVGRLRGWLADIERRSRPTPVGNPKWIHDHARAALKGTP
jgi:hypothetical protein